VARAPDLDLPTVNRWLCITRLRAAGGVVCFAVALKWLGIGDLRLAPTVTVCLLLAGVSAVGLGVRRLERAPRAFFYAQNLADLLGITIGLHYSAHGLTAILFRPIFALTIVPASLLSFRGGLAMAAAATVGHAVIYGAEYGWVVEPFLRTEFVAPPFLFFLVAQQCFFYSAHLRRKNVMLETLAERLEESRGRLAAEVRRSGALLEAARTLSSSLEEPELQARLNWTVRQQLSADWTGTFEVEPERATFRLVAVTDPEAAAGDVGRLALPLARWGAAERLRTESVVVLGREEAQRAPAQFTGGGAFDTLVLAGLHRDEKLVGFLAVGWMRPPHELRLAVELLSGIAQHATVVMRNARLLEEVRQASAMKSEFVGAVSHELRSPLNVMLGYFEMLLDGGLGPLQEEQMKAVERTRHYAVALNEMIASLLDLNRLEAGRLPLQRARVDLTQLLPQIIRDLPESWRSPDVELRTVVGQGVPTIETDPGKLKTVIRNLLHNALKFTHQGAVVLAVRAAPGGRVTISVTDTGRGIPPDAIGYIFDMFRQVPGAGGGGVGLGLHLVRRLLDVLGGRIAVESELGRGARFTITLPERCGQDVPEPEPALGSAASA
jgi:signal transduction histidine kinase